VIKDILWSASHTGGALFTVEVVAGGYYYLLYSFGSFS